MSAFQIFASLIGLALIGFAITVIEHVRAVIGDHRRMTTICTTPPETETEEAVQTQRRPLRGERPDRP